MKYAMNFVFQKKHFASLTSAQLQSGVTTLVRVIALTDGGRSEAAVIGVTPQGRPGAPRALAAAAGAIAGPSVALRVLEMQLAPHCRPLRLARGPKRAPRSPCAYALPGRAAWRRPGSASEGAAAGRPVRIASRVMLA